MLRSGELSFSLERSRMFSRPVLFFGVLLAAVVVPYLLLDENLAQSVGGQWNRLLGKVEEEKDELLASIPTSSASRLSATGAPPTAIEQVFRFDVTPQWVTSRWPQVSTVAGDPQQLGLRVALVSGTGAGDVAGSLTYYFDEHHRLQRIIFSGLTDDPRRILAAVVTPYGLKSQPTTDAARYTAGDPREPTSEVVVRHLPLVGAEVEGGRAEVSVDLRRGDAVAWRANAEREPELKLIPSTYRRW
jgi:hypothetical protein